MNPEEVKRIIDEAVAQYVEKTRPPQPEPAEISLRSALATGSDDFAASNVMAIVVQIDRTLVTTTGNTTVAVWETVEARRLPGSRRAISR